MIKQLQALNPLRLLSTRPMSKLRTKVGYSSYYDPMYNYAPPYISPPLSPTPYVLIFNPATAKDPVRANKLALLIANSPVPSGAPSYVSVASNGTYASLTDFCRWPAGNSFIIFALQDAAGIKTDGLCGKQTLAAFNYFLTHSTRPDGSLRVLAYVASTQGYQIP